jgi:paraquat-inducible protein B
MTSARLAYLRVGVLLATGIAAVIALVLFLGGNRIRGGTFYESYFRESVQGLDIGAPVKYRGVSLGEVTEIGLVSAAYPTPRPNPASRPLRQVYVRFVIDPARLGPNVDAEKAVDAGLRARLASQGLTGLSYIELDFADPERFAPEEVPWTPRYPYIPSMPSTISQVQDAAQGLLAKIQGVDLARLSASLQAVLDDAHNELSTGDAARSVAEAAALLQALRVTVERADLPGLIADLRATSASLRSTLGGKESKEMLASAAQAAQRLSDTMARLPPLLAALQATVQHTDAGRADLQAELAPILRDTRAAAANLRDTTETLRRYPSSVLLGGPPPREEAR